MNQIKIGKFIAGCRKEKHLTQANLAEMIGVTDRAVSKWETGKSMPDSSNNAKSLRDTGNFCKRTFNGRQD